MPIDSQRLQTATETVPEEWTSVSIINNLGDFLAGNLRPSAAETEMILSTFNDEDQTFARGVTVGENKFDVFRYFGEQNPALCYGSRGGPEETQGVCIAKWKAESLEDPVFVMITWRLPSLSAKAIPQLVEFIKTNIV
eukprot:TRINITY_DN316_c0_g1_i1.p1 TRINITY_DN316_c0_g1~~TRINITY_DN316_c0_g1_i1.p1  ORF type:complete len:138 (+),score=10.30 TRINITY_DN316_c0_g1_i1:56-469(+)